MATSFKSLLNQDIQNTRTKLHESIPLTGTVISGTYTDLNIKNYAHGMFQSVYDYPFLSSSANHIMDITLGYASSSNFSSSVATQNTQKIQIYNQMAQTLMGYDSTGSIQRFDQDGDLTAGVKMDNCMFLSFSRLLVKDEIKKGSFSMKWMISSSYNENGSMNSRQLTITDRSGSNSFFSNSPTGEYGILYATGSGGTINSVHHVLTGSGASTAGGTANTGRYFPVGLIFYQAGIVVLTGSITTDHGEGGILDDSAIGALSMAGGGTKGMTTMLTGAAISSSADAIRSRINDLSFNNTVELNSVVYFCRASHNEYNFSSNPTYVNGSSIRVKANPGDVPITYITSVGLYNEQNQLLAVGKLSEPVRKDPSIELIFRARLDY